MLQCLTIFKHFNALEYLIYFVAFLFFFFFSEVVLKMGRYIQQGFSTILMATASRHDGSICLPDDKHSLGQVSTALLDESEDGQS